MHCESRFVDSNLEVDKRLVSKLALRLRRRKGEDGNVMSDSSPPLKGESEVLQGYKY
jgi:hypothetical protein